MCPWFVLSALEPLRQGITTDTSQYLLQLFFLFCTYCHCFLFLPVAIIFYSYLLQFFYVYMLILFCIFSSCNYFLFLPVAIIFSCCNLFLFLLVAIIFTLLLHCYYSVSYLIALFCPGGVAGPPKADCYLTAPSFLYGWSDGLEWSPGCDGSDPNGPLCSISL